MDSDCIEMTEQKQTTWNFASTDDEVKAKKIDSSRDYQRNLMADKRAAERDLKIPHYVVSPERHRYFNDPIGFMKYYFPELFKNPFTDDHREIIRCLQEILFYGGCQSIAIPRGEGKSTITIAFCAWAICYGHAKYVVIVGANGKESAKKLKNFKALFSKKKYQRLASDFPEICIPIRDVAGSPQKAGAQTVDGEKTNIDWQIGELTFPTVAGSQASEAKLTIVGIDGAIRGLVDDGVRPDLVVIDDCETKSSARSRVETEARREAIEKDILGLAGSGETLGVILLCTIIRPGCLADEFTDRQQRPDWMGIRRKFVLSWPDREDMWATYMEMRIKDQMDGDRFARKAHAYYLENKAEMDRGAKVSNAYRYIKIKLPDGTQVEESAIQYAYNELLRKKEHGFNSELQNDPSELQAETTTINEASVCNKLSHIPRGHCPAWMEAITVGVDVSGRFLHWTAMAWKKGMIGTVIDYGTETVHSPTGAVTSEKNLAHTQAAILRALFDLWHYFNDNPFVVAGTGEAKHVDLILIDSGSGDYQPPVYKFVKAVGPTCRAVKGYGKNQRTGKFKMLGKRMPPAHRGAHYYASMQAEHRLYLWHVDADHYKNAVHQGFATPDEMPGCITVFGTESVKHRDFARQITAEVWQREFTPGKGWSEGFEVVYHQNHLLDSTGYAIAAADQLKVLSVLDATLEEEEKVAVVNKQPTMARMPKVRKTLTREEINRRRYG